MITDKTNLIYSLEKSVQELKTLVNNVRKKRKDDKDIYRLLGNTLLWIGICLDRLRTNGEKEVEYETAFRGAYDILKHGNELVSIQRYDKGGMSFPFSSSFTIPFPDYYFIEVANGIIQKQKYIDVYNSVLSGKLVMAEIEKIQQFILQKMEKY